MSKLNKQESKKLKEAVELQRRDFDQEAMIILEELEKENPDNSKILGLLGLVLAKGEKYKEAVPYLKEAIKSNLKNETLSLSLYISYVELGKHKKAFNILFKFLENHPANLFKDTLEELIEGLRQGFGENYRDEILKNAWKNHVEIPDELLD